MATLLVPGTISEGLAGGGFGVMDLESHVCKISNINNFSFCGGGFKIIPLKVVLGGKSLKDTIYSVIYKGGFNNSELFVGGEILELLGCCCTVKNLLIRGCELSEFFVPGCLDA